MVSYAGTAQQASREPHCTDRVEYLAFPGTSGEFYPGTDIIAIHSVTINDLLEISISLGKESRCIL